MVETDGSEDIDVDAMSLDPSEVLASDVLPADGVETVVARLRLEADSAPSVMRRARLLLEIAELEERAGNEAAAAKEYLAAFNADPEFREPLEGLLRLLERRRSQDNMGPLVDALVHSAETADDKARAFLVQAAFFGLVQSDWVGAKGAAREAQEASSVTEDRASALLLLELIATRLGDQDLREEALGERAAVSTSQPWKDLLRLDHAGLVAAGGDLERAMSLAVAIATDGGPLALRAIDHFERWLSQAGAPKGDEDDKARKTQLATALETRASLLQATVGTGGASGDQDTDLQVLDAQIRAADTWLSIGEATKAASIQDSLLAGRADDDPLLPLLLRLRIRTAERQGDTKLSAELALRALPRAVHPGVLAALHMRVAEHAASLNDASAAVAAANEALRAEPRSVTARVLVLDLLAGADDTAGFLAALEGYADQLTDKAAKVRAYVLGAHEAATGLPSHPEADDTTPSGAVRAKQFLRLAEAQGLSATTALSLSRSLSALAQDDAWYTETLEALVRAAPTETDRTLYAFELVRRRILRGHARATEALELLAQSAGGAWLARAIEAFVLGGPGALSALAEVDDPERRRDIVLAEVARSIAGADLDGAASRLSGLLDERSELLPALILAAVERRRGEHKKSAVAARKAGGLATDAELSAACHIEAAISFFRTGEYSESYASALAADAAHAEAARAPLALIARGVHADELEGRREAIDRAQAAGHHEAPLFLERAALEAVLGDPAEAEIALSNLERDAEGALAAAAALFRITWLRGVEDEAAFAAALDHVAALGGAGPALSATEGLRLARNQGPSQAAKAAAHWLDHGGGAPAGVEWFAAALSGGDLRQEVDARRALGNLLTDEAKEAMLAGAILLEHVIDREASPEFVAGTSHAVRLANLEVAPPGQAPARRALALSELGGAMGDEAESDALGMAAWAALQSGNAPQAIELLRTATQSRADSLASWEGLRAAAHAAGDAEVFAVACEQLGARCASDPRGAAFWEQAGLTWSKLQGYEARAETALEASLGRDPSRPVAFDRLFRKVRERKDPDRLLALIDLRLGFVTDDGELGKLRWEQARARREKGDPEGAMEALTHVTALEPDHVGALALTGEIYLRKGMFAEAADALARLSRVAGAPAKDRLTAGVAAVGVYENKLGRHDLALGVLVDLHQAQLSNLAVRERLARAAARTGAWARATAILEELMRERPERSGRIEAARLAMAIYRDRLQTPGSATAAIGKLLSEAPTDGEAIDMLLGLDDAQDRKRAQPMLAAARSALLGEVRERPGNPEQHKRLGRVAAWLGDTFLEHAALSAACSTQAPDGSTEARLATLLAGKPRTPTAPLSPELVRAICAPGDEGPMAQLFQALGPTIGEALGPTVAALGVGKKDRIDARSGLAVRTEIGAWAQAFGIGNFELYVGGRDPLGVVAVAQDPVAIVIGAQVNAPLSPALRGKVARELFALLRGTSIVRSRDDATLGAVVLAAAQEVKVQLPIPRNAALADVEKAVHKAIGRKVRAAIEPICRMLAQGPVDLRAFAERARMTQLRMATVAAGDASVVLTDLFQATPEQAAAMAREDLRAEELLRFLLSDAFFDQRRALGLEGADTRGTR
jgi:hypothetical protein